jgi:hypothetical protein
MQSSGGVQHNEIARHITTLTGEHGANDSRVLFDTAGAGVIGGLLGNSEIGG